MALARYIVAGGQLALLHLVEADELTSNGKDTLSYNANGELARRVVNSSGATTTYDWNARHQLVAVHLPGGTTETFAYDPLGRRVSVSNAGKTTSYVYDGSAVHLEYEGSGGPSASPSAVYSTGARANELLEMARGGKRYSYLVNGQGSTLALADEAGKVAQRYSYDAFGNPTISGELANPFLYTGQMWDPESGLYYDNARYYEPQSGRFISRDLFRDANPYPYVEGDPTNETDPTGNQGLAEEDETEAIGGILDAGDAEGIPTWARFFVDSSSEVTDVTGEADNTITIGRSKVYTMEGQATRTFAMPEETWRAMTAAEQELRNGQFLDEAIARESTIRLASPLSEATEDTGYGWEIRYLEDQGYTPSPDGTEMLPPEF